MKIIFTGETPSFENGLPDGMMSIWFNSENKPVFEIPDGAALPAGAQEATATDLIGLPDQAGLFKKRFRDAALAKITVSVDGMVFDANERSRGLMMTALEAAATLNVASTEWKLHNNIWAMVNVAQLKQAIAQGLVRHGEIMREFE